VPRTDAALSIAEVTASLPAAATVVGAPEPDGQVPAASRLRADPATRRPHAVEGRLLAATDAAAPAVRLATREGLASVRVRNAARRIDGPRDGESAS